MPHLAAPRMIKFGGSSSFVKGGSSQDTNELGMTRRKKRRGRKTKFRAFTKEKADLASMSMRLQCRKDSLLF